MKSAFGVEHGQISKMNVKPFMGNLAPMGALEHTGLVGAGGATSARKLGQAMTGSRVQPRLSQATQRSNAVLNRKAAKTSGRRAAKQLAQGAGTGGASPAVESANIGWQQRASAFAGLSQPNRAAPAGMRGPIAGRASTTKSRAMRSAFQ